jgi:hypothetical protein
VLIGGIGGDLETARLILLAGAGGMLAPLLAGWRAG